MRRAFCQSCSDGKIGNFFLSLYSFTSYLGDSLFTSPHFLQLWDDFPGFSSTLPLLCHCPVTGRGSGWGQGMIWVWEGHSFWSLRRSFSWAMNEGSSKVVGEGAPSESSATLIHEKVSLCLLQQAWLQRTPGLSVLRVPCSTAGWLVSHWGVLRQ